MEAAPTLAKADESQLILLAQLFAGSPVLGNLLVANPVWLERLTTQTLRSPRRKSALLAEWRQLARPSLAERDHAGGLAALRQFKQREMLRIAARDLNRLSNAVDITREISD